MTFRLRQLGDPILTQVAEPVTEFKTPALQDLIEGMLATLKEAQGVGLAAPQVGSLLQVLIVASRPNPRYPEAPQMQPLVMVNPRLLACSSEQVLGWEGCLSVPNCRGLVARAREVEVEYYTPEGVQQRVVWQDFPARIFQHEYDHLMGRVFLQRQPRQLLTEAQYQAQILGQPA
ncbi:MULTISPECIES: peptide deformylase [unclassified Synechococcus]|jgi:peptide deformylase|uniref:peptide deformylase n=1 Tax=unclassified Synechococcus TaxID=2626047 RepID=UPI0000695164|nr:peptide deformylase [Synechococcus sp. JA-2-3B'a(2-13)]ABD03078.1 peptide deformylase [Synechococcus sp. JA-2-3B'a(2-13)]